MTTQLFTGNLVVLACYKCGVTFGLTSQHNTELLRSRDNFYCPNGHCQAYVGESDKARADRLARDLAAAKDREATLRADNEKRYRLQRAAEGKTRALKKRVAAGVCPCCTRTFQNLARHMKSQHPNVISE